MGNRVGLDCAMSNHRRGGHRLKRHSQLFAVIILILLFSLSSAVLAHSETTVYLPFINNPWGPELRTGLFYNSDLYQITDFTFTTSEDFDFTADHDEWILQASTEGGPWRELYRCSRDDTYSCYRDAMSANITLNNTQIGWGSSLLRVYGQSAESRSAYSNLLPVEYWWANMTWNIRLSGSDYGGPLLVRITDLQAPVDPSWWTRTYVSPGECNVTLPPGAVYDEQYGSFYMDLPPSVRQFTFNWQQTGDCVMYIGSYATDDPELLNYVSEQGGVIPKKWPH